MIIKICELVPEMKLRPISCLYQWCYRFLRRSGYSIRIPSHIGQPLPSNIKELIFQFLKETSRKKSYLESIGGDLDSIGNMDETPIYFEMVNKTAINKIGNKNIVANTLGLEKKKISIILSITASGYKLKPLMIFKGKKGKKTEKKLQNLEEVKQKMVVVKCQSEAWCYKDIFTSWIDEVFSPYLLFVSKKTGILILDKETMHD